MSMEIGKKVRELRMKKRLTLQELSSQTNLSTGFLSQLERGLTSIAITSLEQISRVLEVEISYFFTKQNDNKKNIIRSYQKEIFQVENDQFIHYHLSDDLDHKNLLPRLIEILPNNTDEVITTYSHDGEEFIYVLEGILTLLIDNEQYDLFPGDSAHIDSTKVHNWANYTSKTVRLIQVNTPNPFKNKKEKIIKK